jgi:hypothetical protein
MIFGPKTSENPQDDNDQQTPSRDINLRVLAVARKSSSHRWRPLEKKELGQNARTKTSCDKAPISNNFPMRSVKTLQGVLSFGSLGAAASEKRQG